MCVHLSTLRNLLHDAFPASLKLSPFLGEQKQESREKSFSLFPRETEVAEPNRVWVSDITYIWTTEGRLYLTVILDLFSRMVTGWSIKNRITKILVIDALRMAVWRRNPDKELIFHSDWESQYCS